MKQVFVFSAQDKSRLAVTAFISLFLSVFSSVALAQSDYMPFIEPLQAEQQRSYELAAPRGKDQIDSGAGLPSQVTVRLVDEVAEASRLESLAAEQQNALTLEQTAQSQNVTDNLEQFGYNIFNATPTTFAPVDSIPVPDNYRIGPGDNLIVQLFGRQNVEYDLIVTRDGDILVPEFGPIKVSGLSFDEVEQLIVDGFDRRAIGVSAVVTMGRLRTIQIRIAGDVRQPGIYTVGGLTTLVDALLTTGGISSTGTLRDIRLIRNGETIRHLDLYELLLAGDTSEDSTLAHNDTIFVPPIGQVVYIGGQVNRPAIYELLGNESVADVLGMAGNILPTASLRNSHLERVYSQGYRSLIDFSQLPDLSKLEQLAVQNGDLIRILPLEDQLDEVVVLTGHVQRPGGYQYVPGMMLSGLLPDSQSLLPGVDLDFVLVKREEAYTRRTTIIYRNLLKAITSPGSEFDLVLQPRDEIHVFNLSDNRESVLSTVTRDLQTEGTDKRPARLIEVRGAIRFPGTLPLQEGSRLLDVIALTGGRQRQADVFYGLIMRTSYPDRLVQPMRFSLIAAENFPLSQHNPELLPGDRIYVFGDDITRHELIADEIGAIKAQANFSTAEKIVTVLGEVRKAGEYPLTDGMRASDLICAADGLTHRATTLTASLTRQTLSMDEEAGNRHFQIDPVAILEICQLHRDLASNRVSVETFNSRYANNWINPLLQPLDIMTFSEVKGWSDQATIILSGEFNRPGTYAVSRGETLCQVVERAGGITEHAYVFGAELTRESVREMQQQTLDELKGSLDDLMIELSLSHSFNNDEKTSLEWAGKQDYLRAIRDLEVAEASGRMIIDLQDIMQPGCDDIRDVVVENGDRLHLPLRPNYVQVAGQVYVPTSHQYRNDRSIQDYVDLSGGSTTLGKENHTYVIQANGEVVNLSGSRNASRIKRRDVMPGARIYVPLDVDRMNATEKTQSWLKSLTDSAILAGLLL